MIKDRDYVSTPAGDAIVTSLVRKNGVLYYNVYVMEKPGNKLMQFKEQDVKLVQKVRP